MKQLRWRLPFAIMFLGISLVAARVAVAEVAAQRRGVDRVVTLLMDRLSIVDDADPVPQVAIGWEPIGPAENRRVVNASGNIRPDGRPDVVWTKGDGWPVVVWAYNNGTEHDIALAAWNGADWNAIEWITSTPDDELDPRVFLEPDGGLVIAYWIDGAVPQVNIVARSSDADLWSLPARVSPYGEIARRPTVAVFQGATYVAYEREAGTPTQPETEFILRGGNGTSGYNRLHGVIVPGQGDLQLMLHVKDEPGLNRMWVDWAYSAGEYAHSVLQNDTATWNTLQLHPLTDATWVGIETIRRKIERAVLSQLAAVDPM